MIIMFLRIAGPLFSRMEMFMKTLEVLNLNSLIILRVL